MNLYIAFPSASLRVRLSALRRLARLIPGRPFGMTRD